MTPFLTLNAIAAPYLAANVDTDKIIPARFLKTVSKAGLGRALFYDMRYDEIGNRRPDFILNRPPWDEAGILVAGPNFGCGSSREHAPWALVDFGVRCIIAPAFADIFFNNCFKNGILPITLPTHLFGAVASAASDPNTARLEISLPDRQILIPGERTIPFEVDSDRATALMEGRDDIATSLLYVSELSRFERSRDTERAWLPAIPLDLGGSRLPT